MIFIKSYSFLVEKVLQDSKLLFGFDMIVMMPEDI